MSHTLLRAITVLAASVSLLAGCALPGRDLETVFLPTRETWVRVYAVEDAPHTIVELVPEGQKLETWNELCTLESYAHGTGMPPPSEAVRALESKMRARAGHVEWQVLEQDNTSVLYAWTLTGTADHPDQGEIARLIQGRDGVHRAAYAYKTLPLDPARRTYWIDLLKRARVVKGEKEYWAAVDELMPEMRGNH